MLILLLIAAWAQTETQTCRDWYYTKCTAGKAHCKAGYRHNEYHVRWTCFPGFFSYRCDIDWDCAEDEFCGNPTECNTRPECLGDTSDFENWDVTKVEWDLASMRVVQEVPEIELPSYMNWGGANHSDSRMMVTAEYYQTQTLGWQYQSGVRIADMFNFSSTVPVYVNGQGSETVMFDHKWGEGDTSPERNTSFLCEASTPGADVNCKVFAKRVAINVTMTIHLFYPNLGTNCISKASWSGISSYDLYAKSYETLNKDEDSDDKTVAEIIQDLPWYIQVSIVVAFMVCLATLSCVCKRLCGKDDELEPVQLMNPIASEVPNFTNRSDVFNGTNYNLLA